MLADTVTGRRVVGVARWAARISAAALVLFWGAYFVEHLAWFADPHQLPPPWVFVLVGLHFLMLVGCCSAGSGSLPAPSWPSPVRCLSSPPRPGGTSPGSPR